MCLRARGGFFSPHSLGVCSAGLAMVEFTAYRDQDPPSPRPLVAGQGGHSGAGAVVGASRRELLKPVGVRWRSQAGGEAP